MKLTGKCKKDFREFYNNRPINGVYHTDYSVFMSKTISEQIGVYVDFFDSVGIYVNVMHDAYKDGVNILWQVMEYDINNEYYWSNKSTGQYGDNGEYTRPEARTAAIEKANEIYNNAH